LLEREVQLPATGADATADAHVDLIWRVMVPGQACLAWGRLELDSGADETVPDRIGGP